MAVLVGLAMLATWWPRARAEPRHLSLLACSSYCLLLLTYLIETGI